MAFRVRATTNSGAAFAGMFVLQIALVALAIWLVPQIVVWLTDYLRPIYSFLPVLTWPTSAATLLLILIVGATFGASFSSGGKS